ESAQALNQEEDRADGSSGADEITRESL
ncbi:MAG: hypothetical protein RL033_2013, partial [Pseudomonadota bacterium]